MEQSGAEVTDLSLRLLEEAGNLLGFSFFFFNDTATTEIYTLSLHDALPISSACRAGSDRAARSGRGEALPRRRRRRRRSEEHTSELQSRSDLVCRLLLEKKKKNNQTQPNAKNMSYTSS